MRSRSTLVLAAGFGTLLSLVALLGVEAVRRSGRIHNQLVSAHQAHMESDALLRDLPAQLHLAGILTRDYLLDPSQLTAPVHREQLLALRDEMRRNLDEVARRLPPD